MMEDEEKKIFPQKAWKSNDPRQSELNRIQDERLLKIPFLKVRSASSRTRFRLNLNPTHSSKTILALEFRGLLSNEQKLLGHLVWHCLFGKRFKSAHWYFLFNLFEKHFKDNDVFVNSLLYGCLIESTPRKRVASFDVNHIPLWKRFKDIKVPKHFRQNYQDLPDGLIDLIISRLNVPKRALPIDSLVYYFKTSFVQKKPIEPVRIGVGYKDMGSLGSGDRYEPDIPVWNPQLLIDSWSTILDRWDQLTQAVERKTLFEYFYQ